MSRPVAPGGAAFDLRNLDALKLAARRSPQQALRAAAQQMEGVFVQMMLKSMRDAAFQDGPFDSQQSRMFTSLYDQQISQDIAAQGKLGFADMIVRQVQGASMPPAEARPPEALLAASGHSVAASPLTQRDSHARQPAQAETGATQHDGFLARLIAPAQAAAQQSGIPHLLIVAQAALESGWGKHEILTRDGRPSHNLFGIKATPDWQGDTADIVTTEYFHGVAQHVRAAFRVYKNEADALTDYVHFITRNPRYQKVIHSESIEKAARALQESGYATDPDYASKLINIVRHVENNISNSVKADKSGFDALF